MQPIKEINIFNDECPICLGDNIIVLPCGHGMCVTCFYEWYVKMYKPSKCTICSEHFYYSNCKYITYDDTIYDDSIYDDSNDNP